MYVALHCTALRYFLPSKVTFRVGKLGKTVYHIYNTLSPSAGIAMEKIKQRLKNTSVQYKNKKPHKNTTMHSPYLQILQWRKSNKD
jgi:hypothetical protein